MCVCVTSLRVSPGYWAACFVTHEEKRTEMNLVKEGGKKNERNKNRYHTEGGRHEAGAKRQIWAEMIRFCFCWWKMKVASCIASS